MTIATNRTLRLFAVVAFLTLAAGAPGSRAAAPPSTRGPIATLGNRTVDALDIQIAAVALAGDPLRRQNPTRWRRMLLDRSVDRELLAMEAERRGIANDREVRQRIAEREFLRLYQEVHQGVLLPSVEPTGSQLDSLRRTGLYRMMDLHYILLRDNEGASRRQEAEGIVARLRQGARFDSIASTKSGHPSRGNGGHFGPVLVRDLDPGSLETLRTAKPGDVLGPYSGRYGHEIYKVGGFEELSRDSLKSLIRTERERNLVRDYEARLLARYHFALEPKMVPSVLFAVGSETPDSIMMSLSPEGTRPRRGIRPALGVIARVDGDSIHFRDLIRETKARRGSARQDPDPRRVRLRELAGRHSSGGSWCSTPRSAGWRRSARSARAAPDSGRHRRGGHCRAGRAPPIPLRQAPALFDEPASRYRRPEARRARVAVFPTRDSAFVALRGWNGVGIADSSLRALGFTEQPKATASTLYPGHAATILVIEGDADPLALAVRTLGPGQTSPVVKTMQGYAVAHVLAREPARPLTLDEAMDRVRRDWREEKENEWVLSQLERMRATTPVKIVPARLEALKLGPAKGTGPGSEASR